MSDFTLGQHEAKLEGLEDRTTRIEASVTGVHAKLDAVIVSLAERQGERKAERKAVALLATAAGGLGSFLVSVLLKLWHK